MSRNFVVWLLVALLAAAVAAVTWLEPGSPLLDGAAVETLRLYHLLPNIPPQGGIRPAWMGTAEAALVLVSAGLMVALARRDHPFTALLLAFALLVAAVGAGVWALMHQGWVVDIVRLTAAFAVIALGVLAGYAAAEDEQPEKSHLGFAGKVPSGARGFDEKGELAGDLRKVTIMAVRMRNFAEAATELRDRPAALADLMRRFNGEVIRRIQAGKGTVVSISGDGIRAVWNAPMLREDHASAACETALSLVDRLDAMNETLAHAARTKGYVAPTLHLGIGINTGHVLVGDLGTPRKPDYGIAGAPAEAAARLARLSLFYGPAVIVGEHTYNAVLNRYALLEIDKIVVDGRDFPVRLFALAGSPVVKAGPRFQAVRLCHEAFFKAYRAQRWVDARALAAEGRKLGFGPSNLYDLFEARIAQHEKISPGMHWDGTDTAQIS